MGPALCGATSERLCHCSQPGMLSGPILSRFVEHMRSRCVTECDRDDRALQTVRRCRRRSGTVMHFIT